MMGSYFTRRKLNVEYVVLGPNVAQLPFELPGNLIDGDVTFVGQADWSPGTRHLLVLSFLPKTELYPATWYRMVDKVIPAGQAVPPLSDMKAIFAEHCAEFRPDLQPVSGQPSLSYLNAAGVQKVSECKHY